MPDALIENGNFVREHIQELMRELSKTTDPDERQMLQKRIESARASWGSGLNVRAF